ncbi:MAG: NB-ARC domain-containing protein [Ardenticatenaceae bacterium]
MSNENEQTNQQPSVGGAVPGDHKSSQVVEIKGDGTIRDVTQIIINPPATDRSTAAPLYLPAKVYHRFVGRWDQLDEVMSALRTPKRKPIVALVGLGGIGKTALARETVDLCQQERLFEHVVWRSFKTEHFISEGTIKTEEVSYNFNELLNDIGRQCNRLDITKMPSEQKHAAVKYLLATKPVLIVMDNLESVPEAEREKLVADLFQILGKSKLLITSRHHIKHERVFTVELRGFPEEEGVIFLREDSKERGISVVAQASRKHLVEIHDVTGGAPLAMKLVAGQMSRLPMMVVLDTLKQASFKGPDYPLYRFIYQQSWQILDMNGQMTLVDMSIFPPITGGAATHVQTMSQLEPLNFWQAINLLVTLSLVDKSGSAGQERFSLHSLTQYFVRSDITKEWAS